MRSTRSALGACIIISALLAGCGGGGGGGSTSPVSPPVTPQAQPGSVQVTMSIPASAPAGTSVKAKSPRKANYVSASTNGLGISVVAHGAVFPNRLTPTAAYDVSSASVYCTPGVSGSRSCTFFVPAPAGNDDFQISGWDAKPVAGSFVNARLLSSTVVNKTISGTAVNTLTFSMSGSITSIFLRLSSNTMVAGQSNTDTLNVEALDADGNIITGSDPFVDANGNLMTITINATPTGGPGTVSLSSTTVTNPSNSTIGLTYNGALLGSVLFTATPSLSLPAAGTNTSATLNFTISNLNLGLPPNPVVTTYSVTSASNPQGVAAGGVDGNLWFAETGSKKIARVTTSGTITEYSTGLTNAPASMAYGLDGDMYFTESDRLGRINPYTFAIDEFALFPGSTPVAITRGPQGDNDMWFSDNGNNVVGTIAFGTGLASGYAAAGTPGALTIGPDGNVWYLLTSSAQVATMATSGGASTLYNLAAAGNGIAVGADGNLWITEPSVNKIARVTTAGVVTQFSGLSTGSGASQIVSGMDGNLWFIEPALGKVGRITTTGIISEYASGLSPTGNLGGIASGPDGNLWISEPGVNLIGKVQP